MYKVKGADQKEYGPITTDQVKQWIAENRLNRFSLCERDGAPGWRPLSDFAEFQDALRGVGGGPAAPAPVPAAAGTGVLGSPVVPENQTGNYFQTGQQAGSRESALQLVNGPAVGLIIMGILGLIAVPLNLVGSLYTGALPNLPNIPDENVRRMIEGWLSMSKSMGIVSAILSLPWNAAILWGGLKMRKLEHHSFALVAAVLSIIPCFACCCLISMPIGIWALVVLNKPEVKGQFR